MGIELDADGFSAGLYDLKGGLVRERTGKLHDADALIAALDDMLDVYKRQAMDGVWFQSVERKLGMHEAMYHDAEAWKRFTVIEARRIKAFLKLPERAGLTGLSNALSLRFYANINRDEIVISGNTLTYRVLDCRVQTARARKNICLLYTSRCV